MLTIYLLYYIHILMLYCICYAIYMLYMYTVYFSKSSRQGAQTQIYLAASTKLPLSDSGI